MAMLGRLIPSGIDLKKDDNLDIPDLSKCYNIYLYYLPMEALVDRDSFATLCSQIEKDLKGYINKSTGSERKNAFIFIITSSGLAGYTMDEKEISNEFPHISFLINSNASVTLINIYKNQLQVKEFIRKKIIEKLKLVKRGYAPGFEDNRFEYLLYNLRLQEKNKLDTNYSSSGAHGKHITPFLYSNELQRKQDTIISDELSFFFAYDESGEKKVKGMDLRILLIDDKIKSKTTDTQTKRNEPEISSGKDSTLSETIDQKESQDCKAALVKKLLELPFEKNKGITDPKEFLQSRVCWLTPSDKNKETVCLYYLDEFVDSETSKLDVNSFKEKLNKKEEKNKIQIIAVQNLALARQLLSEDSLRFDLVMMDYLLAEKPDKKGEREYATEFWGDGNEKYFEFSKDFSEKKYTEEQILKYTHLKSTYNKIKSNRGPMQRLWIFPITAFNQTFIDDLRNKGVRLIDYYWYLSRGADPINTPYLFIYTLNKFLQLQIESAIFNKEELQRFLEKSFENVKDVYDKQKSTEKKVLKANLKYLFGSEYVFFISNYGTEEQIARDANQGSLFANYIKENFFKKQENLSRLNRAIRKFYHSLAYGEDNEKEQCEERWLRVKDLLKLVDSKYDIQNEPVISRAIKDRFYHEAT